MKFDLTPYSVSDLVSAFEGGSLVRNPEYQRGASWNRQQKQALVDSVFRDYPLPALFLEVKEKKGLGGEPSKIYEVIDGQQRILALVEFSRGDFDLLHSNDPKLRLPLSMRSTAAPWEGRRYADLSSELREKFHNCLVQAYLVKEVANSDEVRDLFIRLQSGTALTRQQVRDAWPGELGPRIVRWAGKLTVSPKFKFFDAVDGRGTRDDEDDTNDAFVKHRTTCAQLCQILLARQENPFATPSIKASDLDAMYHRYTLLNQQNNPIDAVEAIFEQIDDVISRIAVKTSGRRKVSKSSLFALAMFLSDVNRTGRFKLTTESKTKLANAVSEPTVTQNSRSSSGGVIQDYYERWRKSLPQGVGIELDAKRAFDDSDKAAIREAAKRLCAVCQEEVSSEDEEFDHYPVPYRDGGRTVTSNGRLVHKECHPRGRPPLD